MSGQAYRAPSGGRIDRDRPLRFTFDGRALTGFAGDTLAAALLANGVRLVGRSLKYHRPRGIVGAGVEEPNALVQIRTGSRSEPNVRATRVELFDGLVAHSQNRWPSLAFDLGAITNHLSRFLPAGFYYKTFKWPGSWWRLYERVIRNRAGLGKAPLEPDPDHYDRRYAHCDVLVVGAGPAGLTAALSAARSGARVMLIDDGAEPGGQLLGSTERIDGGVAMAWVESASSELRRMANVRLLTRTAAFGYYDDNMIVAVEHLADHLPEPPPCTARQRVWWIRAGEVVLATGAIERPLVFADNDRPGVMLASATRIYANQHAVACGRRAVVFTNNDSAYTAVAALQTAGVEVAAVIDARAGGPSRALSEDLGERGVALVAGHLVCGTRGTPALTGIDVCAPGAPGAIRRIACDLLCLSGGWNPTVHLFSQSQGRLRFDEDIHAFVPAEPRQETRCAGAADGTFPLSQCLRQGIEEGGAAAAAAGFDAAPMDTPHAADAAEAPMEALWSVALPAGQRAKRFVDWQNDVTAEDIGLAAREGYSSVEHLKRYTTLGMGTDQGRTSNVNGLAILAQTVGEDMASVGTTTFRPPYTPVTLGALAGRETGKHFAPVRRSPLHDWHVAAGAKFVTAGLWLRAQYYPRPGESMMQSIYAEARAVRESVGIVDVSPLGKIAVAGADAAEFLERVYINRWKSLKVGRCRYGFMLREDGFVLDDGTTTRIAENEYYMTTTTAKAGPVLAHLEFYAQTVWPELDVRLSSVTDQWGGMALAGPNSRKVLETACDGTDAGNEALPFMGYLETTLAGFPVRLIRMTFSGELAYEVHTPSDYTIAVWEALLAAGRPWHIVTYGTEAMSVLRIEKGHVVGGELDGRTLPADFGFDRMQRTDTDFIGRRSLSRPGLGTDARKTFVGLIAADGHHIPRGAQLVWNPTAPKPVKMLGHVTATYYSPSLEQEIALALLEDAQRYQGKLLYAASPLSGQHVPVRITTPVFIDPEGARPRG